jgi:hypothetical protein
MRDTHYMAISEYQIIGARKSILQKDLLRLLEHIYCQKQHLTGIRLI